MALNSSLLKQAVNSQMPTQQQLKSDVWSALLAIGIKAIDKNKFPNAIDIRDISEAITEVYWQHIQTVSDLLCDEVISHIVANAVVNTTVAVASVSGVTTGPSVSGPGTGTGTGTVS